MKLIQLHIPDDLAKKVSHLTSNVETFILDLVRSKINEMNKQPLPLADEYRMAAVENKNLQKDFTTIDTEGWDDEY